MRLVDADAIVEKLRKISRHVFGTDDIPAYSSLSIDFIYEAPTVDAVPVVRCEDCVWYDHERSECHNPRYGKGRANYPPPSVNEEYYCADGKHREEGAGND